MVNIKRSFLNLVLSAICFILVSACQTSKEAPVKIQKPVEIAILMPLMGAKAYIGNQYNQLIKMGLEDGLNTYANIISYNVVDEKSATESMKKIIAHKTQIILGPLYSPLTSAISSQAKQHGIIIISMSNDPTLGHDNVYVFGHAPLKQLYYTANHFLDNHKNIIALLPEGKYSQATSKILQDLAIQKNATLDKVEFYSNNPESINKSAAKISEIVDAINEIEDNNKPVIYVNDDEENLQLLFTSIAKYNLDKKAIIIGDNRIDVKNPPIDIKFTGSLNFLNSNIQEKAKKLGISHLSFMHLMAYDLGKITSTYIGEEFNQDHFTARLNSPEPYVGVSGNIHFVENIAQRKYDIIQRENNIYSTIGKELKE